MKEILSRPSKRISIALFCVALLALIGGVGGCRNRLASRPGGLRVSLADSPGNLPPGTEHIYLTISRVEVHSPATGWVAVVSAPQIRDLLTLVNGAMTVLGDTTLESGFYTQMRLIISGATITISGISNPLEIPSGEETGIKLLNFELRPDVRTDLVVDFDTERSIHSAGDRYILHPTYGVSEAVALGSAIGQVFAAGTSPREGIRLALALAGAGADTFTTYSDSVGQYKLALPAGTYNLQASATGFLPDTASHRSVPIRSGVDTMGIDFALVAQP